MSGPGGRLPNGGGTVRKSEGLVDTRTRESGRGYFPVPVPGGLVFSGSDHRGKEGTRPFGGSVSRRRTSETFFHVVFTHLYAATLTLVLVLSFTDPCLFVWVARLVALQDAQRGWWPKEGRGGVDGTPCRLADGGTGPVVDSEGLRRDLVLCVQSRASAQVDRSWETATTGTVPLASVGRGRPRGRDGGPLSADDPMLRAPMRRTPPVLVVPRFFR